MIVALSNYLVIHPTGPVQLLSPGLNQELHFASVWLGIKALFRIGSPSTYLPDFQSNVLCKLEKSRNSIFKSGKFYFMQERVGKEQK
jgi:hypothetical protein